MSVKYKLSQRYTNHCIRVTTVQVLEDNNIEGRHIQRVSGHKSLESIKCYARRLSAARQRGISDVLSNHVTSKDVSSETPTSSNSTNPIQSRPIVPNFNLVPEGLRHIDDDPI